MNTDRYTKGVLTVIALSLTAIAVQMAIPDAHAQRYSGSNGIQLVAICDVRYQGSGGVHCADVVGDRLQVSSR